jgi:amidase/6-aminohexanoate-cyclic-dimer hydrolase
MDKTDYTQYDALGLAELVANGDVSATELLSCAEQMTQDHNPGLNALVTPMWEQAAESIGNGLAQSPLSGVPMPLKDLGLYYRGVVTSNGSRLFADNVADHDSTLVQRYKAAGLVLSGKTNTPEFGLATTTEPQLHGPTRNPWSHNHSTGGSSGGAAAAVAAGMFPVAHASDGGGSIRIPAGCCGLFGLKPTRGRVPLGPAAVEGWGGLSTTHVISRSVRDSAMLLDISAGAEPGSPYHAPYAAESFSSALEQPPGQLRIALCLESFNGAPVTKEVADLTKQNALILEALGHNVEQISHPFDPNITRDAHGTLAVSHIGAMLNAKERELGRPLSEADVERVSWNNFLGSQQLSAAAYATAVSDIHRNGQLCAQLFNDFDLLLSPTMACLTPEIGSLDMMSEDSEQYLALLYQMIGFTALFNDTGNPAVSVPLSMAKNGLPVGCQLVGDFGAERLLLSVSQQLSSAGYFTKNLNQSG